MAFHYNYRIYWAENIQFECLKKKNEKLPKWPAAVSAIANANMFKVDTVKIK